MEWTGWQLTLSMVLMAKIVRMVVLTLLIATDIIEMNGSAIGLLAHRWVEDTTCIIFANFFLS